MNKKNALMGVYKRGKYMNPPTFQEMSREQVERIADAQQKLALQLTRENNDLKEVNEKLRERYDLLLNNSFPTSYVKHLLKIASCLLSAVICGFLIIANGSPLSVMQAAIFFIGSFLGAFLLPVILTFLCEITDAKFLNEKVSPFAPYLIIPLIYLYIILNFN